ncbi:alpha/beta hydrolase [bacterium]|nr:alpha/beta hydrolase [bacterium]
MAKQKIYCLSGLGADYRAFSKLDLVEYELVHLPWITPKTDETLSEYSLRMMEGIKEEEPFAIMGMSFGGMIASEIRNHIQPKHLILISSIAQSAELPKALRIAGEKGLHKVFPSKLMIGIPMVYHKVFGVTETEDKQLLDAIMRDMDPLFLKWAVNAILNWNFDSEDRSVRIHGTRDLLLPVTENIDYEIKDAGHFAIITHADEVSSAIKSTLAEEASTENQAIPL